MLRLAKSGLLFTLVLVLATSGALADNRRVALVVGNGEYQHTTKLQNAPNDAKVISDKLKKLGFDVVGGVDLDRDAFRSTLRVFARKLQFADVAVLFYAGHGLQVSGVNYLVPVDANIVISADLQWEAVSMQTIMNQMEGQRRVSIVILDACRDNPLSRRLARTMGTRSSSVGRGLAKIVAGTGAFVAFATAPHDVALDGKGKNSPFTVALAKHIETPGLDISQLFRRVRVDVENATSGQQIPWSNSSLRHDFQFNAKSQQKMSSPARAPMSSTIMQQFELAHWNAVKDSNSPILLETYLEQYPLGRFGKLAKLLIDKASKAKQQATLRAAEKKRNGVNVATEKAEDSKSRFAAAHPDNPKTAGDPVASVETGAKQLALGIQRDLQRLGCDPGPVDGVWGGKSRSALRRFNISANAKLNSDEPTQEAARKLSAKTGRVCPIRCGSRQRLVKGRCIARSQKKTRRASASTDNKATRSKRSSKTPRKKPSSSSSGSSGVTIGIGGKRGGIGVGLSF